MTIQKAIQKIDNIYDDGFLSTNVVNEIREVLDNTEKTRRNQARIEEAYTILEENETLKKRIQNELRTKYPKVLSWNKKIYGNAVYINNEKVTDKEIVSLLSEVIYFTSNPQL